MPASPATSRLGGRAFLHRRHLHEMREYAAVRGWSVAAEFVDEGLSSEKWARPGLEALLALVAAGRVGVLLAYELSRLSRSLLHHTLEIFELLGRHNVSFAAVKDPDFTFAEPPSGYCSTILAAANKFSAIRPNN